MTYNSIVTLENNAEIQYLYLNLFVYHSDQDIY